MDTLSFSLLALGGSIAAGFLGSLTGLGGGVVIIPMLVLLLGVDLQYAIAASLMAVIATSSGAAMTLSREGYTNLRLGLLLEIPTTLGAVGGALISHLIPKPYLATIFGLVLLWTAWSSRKDVPLLPADSTPDPLAQRLKLFGTYPTPEGTKPYLVQRVPQGLAIMFGAGVLSALVGIGSGILKVFAMDRMMRVPFKVSTATSNFMIGVTAAASTGVYLHRGQIDPTIAAPVALGALAGAFTGARLLKRAKIPLLRTIFAVVVALAGVQMMFRAWSGGL